VLCRLILQKQFRSVALRNAPHYCIARPDALCHVAYCCGKNYRGSRDFFFVRRDCFIRVPRDMRRVDAAAASAGFTDEDRAPIDRCRARQFCVVKSEVSNMDEPSETV
jgi:hypothetical protein